MKSLYNPQSLKEVLQRIDKIQKDQKPAWGKMNASQMMEHCARIFDYGTGKDKPKRMFLGYILGPFVKSQYYNDKPWNHGTPTSKQYTVTEMPEFERTRNRLTSLITEFSTGGHSKCTSHPSPFFGHLSPEQHGLGMYKHLDHHLMQFEV
ncbi:MAG: DUF1569 domain-containing protein [Bacteroidia bacterium]|nr:DUF1569 domain-containing protein [Bacteroidia bacterium]